MGLMGPAEFRVMEVLFTMRGLFPSLFPSFLPTLPQAAMEGVVGRAGMEVIKEVMVVMVALVVVRKVGRFTILAIWPSTPARLTATW